MVRAPDTIDTPRLILRRPRASDAEAIFSRYASDPDVTRYVGWPAHKSVDDTRVSRLRRQSVATVAGRVVPRVVAPGRHAARRHRSVVRDAAPRDDRVRARQRRLGSRLRHRSAD